MIFDQTNRSSMKKTMRTIEKTSGPLLRFTLTQSHRLVWLCFLMRRMGMGTRKAKREGLRRLGGKTLAAQFRTAVPKGPNGSPFESEAGVEKLMLRRSDACGESACVGRRDSRHSPIVERAVTPEDQTTRRSSCRRILRLPPTACFRPAGVQESPRGCAISHPRCRPWP